MSETPIRMERNSLVKWAILIGIILAVAIVIADTAVADYWLECYCGDLGCVCIPAE